MKVKRTSIPHIGQLSLCWTPCVAWLVTQKIKISKIRNWSVVWLRLGTKGVLLHDWAVSEDGLARRKEEEDLCCHYSTNWVGAEYWSCQRAAAQPQCCQPQLLSGFPDHRTTCGITWISVDKGKYLKRFPCFLFLFLFSFLACKSNY